jgi:hypothetical protein
MAHYYAFFATEQMHKQMLQQLEKSATFGYNTTDKHPELNDKVVFIDLEQQKVFPYTATVLQAGLQNSRSSNSYNLVVKIDLVYGNIPLPYSSKDADFQVFHQKHREKLIEIPTRLFNKVQELFQGRAKQGLQNSERLLLDQVKQYIAAKGYYFEDKLLYNYHICLKTRPFVILAGYSGTGKSKLPQLYAEALGYGQDYYLRVAVRPNWTNEQPLLGHLSSFARAYVREPVLDFLIKASEDSENLYFLCLDEMNIARVEHYFAQFLSAMEEDDPDKRILSLYSESMKKLITSNSGLLPPDPSLVIPSNVLITGTINTDETTRSLSEKVLDRANTLAFFDVDLEKLNQSSQKLFNAKINHISVEDWQNHQVREPDETYYDRLQKIINVLLKARIGFSYRTAVEIGLYIANSRNLLSPEEAFDFQVKQRVLPRVHGPFKAISGVLQELKEIASDEGFPLPHSEKCLEDMQFRLERDGYARFWP